MVLVRDLPEYGLKAGDLGAVVEGYPTSTYEGIWTSWTPPTTGPVALTYDLVRSSNPADFVTNRVCVEFGWIGHDRRRRGDPPSRRPVRLRRARGL